MVHFWLAIHGRDDLVLRRLFTLVTEALENRFCRTPIAPNRRLGLRNVVSSPRLALVFDNSRHILSMVARAGNMLRILAIPPAQISF